MNFNLETLRDWCYQASSSPYAAHGCYITYLALYSRKMTELASEFDLLLLNYIETNYPYKLSPVLVSQPIMRVHLRKSHHTLQYQPLSLIKMKEKLLASRTNLSPNQEEHSVVYEAHEHEYGLVYKLVIRKADHPEQKDLRAYPQNLLTELRLVREKLTGGAV